MAERSRLTLVLRLGLLLGLPVAVIAGLFCFGVWLGARNGPAVRGFEREVLGLKIPDEADADKTLGQRIFGPTKERWLGPEKPKAIGDAIAQSAKTPGNSQPGNSQPRNSPGTNPDVAANGATAGTAPATQGNSTGTGTSTPANGDPTNATNASGTTGTAPTGSSAGAGTSTSGGTPALVDPLDTPIAIATPLTALEDKDPERAQANLAAAIAALKKPRRVAVKLLVERAWVQEHPAWIDEMQRLVAHASADYTALLGIEFEIHAIAIWEINSASLSLEDLHKDLRARSREDADILVGIATKSSTTGSTGLADSPVTLADLTKSKTAPEFHGAYAVVLSTPGLRQPHLHTLLHELGHLFGATDIETPDTPGWSAGSIMSYIAVNESVAPHFDPVNRQRMLLRKHLPFVTDDEMSKILQRSPIRMRVDTPPQSGSATGNSTAENSATENRGAM